MERSHGARDLLVEGIGVILGPHADKHTILPRRVMHAKASVGVRRPAVPPVPTQPRRHVSAKKREALQETPCTQSPARADL